MTQQNESIKDLDYVTRQIYTRVHRELTALWLMARRNQVSSFPEVNADIQTTANDWLMTLHATEAEGMEAVLKDADSFLDGIVSLYSIDFSKPAANTANNPMYAAV